MPANFTSLQPLSAARQASPEEKGKKDDELISALF
jgi:hypothetical protein